MLILKHLTALHVIISWTTLIKFILCRVAPSATVCSASCPSETEKSDKTKQKDEYQETGEFQPETIPYPYYTYQPGVLQFNNCRVVGENKVLEAEVLLTPVHIILQDSTGYWLPMMTEYSQDCMHTCT